MTRLLPILSPPFHQTLSFWQVFCWTYAALPASILWPGCWSLHDQLVGGWLRKRNKLSEWDKQRDNKLDVIFYLNRQYQRGLMRERMFCYIKTGSYRYVSACHKVTYLMHVQKKDTYTHTHSTLLTHTHTCITMTHKHTNGLMAVAVYVRGLVWHLEQLTANVRLDSIWSWRTKKKKKKKKQGQKIRDTDDKKKWDWKDKRITAWREGRGKMEG